MTNNYIDINTINFNVSINECFQELCPHPKFRHCTFDNYKDDANYPSQLLLKDILKKITSTVKKNNIFLNILNKNKVNKIAKNLYIDGSYGIGKTHLLSASFHQFKGSKAFLSFIELAYFMNFLGLEKTIDYFKNIDLLLIDEFDLDDPATTRMIARFITSINQKTTIITTSNRLPKELGGGKFDTSQFTRELGIISNTFDIITVEGKSFRLNLSSWKANYSSNNFLDTLDSFETKKNKLFVSYDSLIKKLIDNHPFKFFIIPKQCDAVFIENFRPFDALSNAVRFSIFIDHCYYYDTKLFIKQINNKSNDIFTKEMMETTFERQFLRCKSRLDELALFF